MTKISNIQDKSLRWHQEVEERMTAGPISIAQNEARPRIIIMMIIIIVILIYS